MKTKSLFLCLILIFSGLQSYSQELIKIHLDKNGNLIGQAIVEVKGKTAPEIYNSTLDWVANTFVRTKTVMQSKIENKMVRIRGVSPSVLGPFTIIGLRYDLSYRIQIDIKDGKLRFTATNLVFGCCISAGPYLFKPNGKQRTGVEKRKFKKQTDAELSRLLNSLVTTIEGKTKSSGNW